MSVEMIFGSVVLSAIISGLISLYSANRSNGLEYITKERSDWREEIRICSEQLRSASYQNTVKICDRLKTRINALGRRMSNRYSDDAHIWEIIEIIENKNFNMNKLSKLQLILQEYLSLLLKWDWERSKREVRGEKAGVIQLILWIISVVIYATGHFYEYIIESKVVDIVIICENILLIVLTVFMIYYIEKQVECSCIIKFVGHVVKKQKKVSFANYLITNCITSILAVIAIIGYFVYMLYSTKMMGITYNDNLLIFMISSSLFGAGAVFYHHIYMSDLIKRYYTYASTIDLIKVDLEKILE